MSRIEEALAKAAQAKGQEPVSPGTRKAARLQVTPLHAPHQFQGVEVPEPTLAAVAAPLSHVAEEYRKIKETLVTYCKKERFQNLIMVTSAAPGEGKTVTAINLAASLAQEYDHTVLLIDADLRRPTCHRYLGYENTSGLADCLLDGKDVGECLIKTGIGRLSLLPSGRVVDNPTELFSSNSMKLLLKDIKNRYADRFIIVDTPPVLPFAETRSLSGIVDGALLVVREGVASLDDIQEAIEALGKKVVGLIYNGGQAITATQYAYHYYR